MTPQLKLVSVGAVTTAAAKFYFGKDWQTSLLAGVAAIAVIAILTAHADANPQ